MAKRRMISTDVVSTDAFLGMSLRARELYLHVNLEADDDGFIPSALKVTRMVGASKKHLSELVDKGYLIAFEGGLHLVTHWLLNNQIRKARYVPTIYQKEKALVTTQGNANKYLKNMFVLYFTNKQECLDYHRDSLLIRCTAPNP